MNVKRDWVANKEPEVNTQSQQKSNLRQKMKSESGEGVLSGRTYHDIPGLRHETRDVLKSLDANMNLLEDLCGRLSFVLAEVRTVTRRKTIF